MNLNFQNSTHFQNILRIYTFWIYFELFGIFKILWEYHEIFKIFFSIFSMLLREVTFPARRACIPVFICWFIHILSNLIRTTAIVAVVGWFILLWCARKAIFDSKMVFSIDEWTLRKETIHFSCPPATFQSSPLPFSSNQTPSFCFPSIFNPQSNQPPIELTFSIFTQKSWKEQLI